MKPSSLTATLISQPFVFLIPTPERALASTSFPSLPIHPFVIAHAPRFQLFLPLKLSGIEDPVLTWSCSAGDVCHLSAVRVPECSIFGTPKPSFPCKQGTTIDFWKREVPGQVEQSCILYFSFVCKKIANNAAVSRKCLCTCAH